MASPLAKAQDQNDVLIQQLFFFNTLQNDQTNFYYGNISLKTNEIIEGDISLKRVSKTVEYHAIFKKQTMVVYIFPNTEIEDIVLVSKMIKIQMKFTRFYSTRRQRQII